MAGPDLSGILFILIAIITAAWFSYLLIKQKKLHLPVRPGVYIFLGLTAITSTVHSINIAISVYELVFWFIAAFIFLVVYNLVLYGYPKKHLVNAALITGAVFLALKSYQAVYLFMARTNTCSKIIRLQNKTAAFAGMILFLSLAVAFNRQGRAKIFPYTLAVFSVIIALLTGSRGGLVAIAAAAIVFINVSDLTDQTKILKDWRNAVTVLSLIVLAPVAAIKILRPVECVSLADPGAEPSLNSAWTSNITAREDSWKLAVNITNAYPGLGSGPGTFSLFAVPAFEGSGAAAHAHNIYLNTMAERGLIGLSALIAALLVTITYIGIIRPDPALAAAGVAIIVAYCIQGLVDVVAVEPFILRYMAVILALAMTPGRESIKHAADY
jgi:O-antigen ligase